MHDLEGEGEEDEVTTHEIRSKVFRMTKDKEGKAQWGDLGVGMLRLKRHKETEARRVLLRNSGTGKITIVCILSVFVFVLQRAVLTLILLVELLGAWWPQPHRV